MATTQTQDDLIILSDESTKDPFELNDDSINFDNNTSGNPNDEVISFEDNSNSDELILDDSVVGDNQEDDISFSLDDNMNTTEDLFGSDGGSNIQEVSDNVGYLGGNENESDSFELTSDDLKEDVEEEKSEIDFSDLGSQESDGSDELNFSLDSNEDNDKNEKGNLEKISESLSQSNLIEDQEDNSNLDLPGQDITMVEIIDEAIAKLNTRKGNIEVSKEKINVMIDELEEKIKSLQEEKEMELQKVKDLEAEEVSIKSNVLKLEKMKTPVEKTQTASKK